MAPADNKKMAEIIGAVMATQVTPTDEMKTIAGYKCRKYNVRIAVMNVEYWVSKDVRAIATFGTRPIWDQAFPKL